MRIAPRTLLCANEYRIRSGQRRRRSSPNSRSCAPSAGDKRSLAIGLAGLALATQLGCWYHAKHPDLQQNSYNCSSPIDDPALTVALSVAYLNINLAGGKIAAGSRNWRSASSN